MARSPKSRPPPRLPVAVVQSGVLTLPSEATHYLLRVRRLQVGDAVILFDGRGTEAEAHISNIQGKEALLTVQAPSTTAPGLLCTVGLAAPKGERADWVVEKLTEVGVQRIVWVTWARSVVVPDPQRSKFERWERLCAAAARQSGRAHTPTVEGPWSLRTFLDLNADLRLLGDPEGSSIHSLSVPDAARGVSLLIGPEGGIDPNERLAAHQAGYYSVRLAPQILRIETAAIVGAAHLLGRFETRVTS